MLGYSPGFGIGINRSFFSRPPFNVTKWELITFTWDTINTVWA
jgi:hypothetical protein